MCVEGSIFIVRGDAWRGCMKKRMKQRMKERMKKRMKKRMKNRFNEKTLRKSV